MSRFVTAAVVAILLLSAVITLLTSAVLSPGNAPDERHHYSYIKHVAEHPLQFPPRYQDIRTGRDEPNHLVHPPLYYQLMAIPYLMLGVDRQMTAVGEELDEHGWVSNRAAIPALRAASLLLAGIHLVGLFFLLRYLVTAKILPGWGAIVAAACLAWVPGFTFIAATLNNDVLALALWPLLVLVTVRFVRERRRTDAYAATILVAAAVLTKATLWALALVCAIAVAVRMVAAVRGGGVSGATAPSLLWKSFGPRSASDWAWIGLAGLSVVAAVGALAGNVVRYGALQPAYHVVFGLALEESKFYNVPPAGVAVKSPGEFAMWAISLTLRSLFGILSHNERLYPPHPERLAQAALALTLVAVVVAGWRLARRPQLADWLAAAMILTVLAFVGIFLVQSYGAYHRYGHFGAQGRYLIAFVDLWVLGLLILVWRTREVAQRRWSRAAAGLLAVTVVAALVALFVRPFFYLSRTVELHARAEVAQHVRKQAARQGMTEVELHAVAPPRFVASGAAHAGGLLPAPRFLMGWRGSTVEASLKTGEAGCVEIWIHGTGEKAWGDPTELAIRLRPPDGAPQQSVTEGVVDLPPHPDVARVVLPTHGSGRLVLTVQALNVRAPAPWPVLDEVWPRTRIAQVFSVYAGPKPCR